MPGFKQGLDYWPRSVQLVKDPKLRGPKMTYGYLAVIIYELLLDLLYMDKGYYIDYRRKDDVIWTVMEGLQGKYQPTNETIEEIIERLVACELFSGDHFKRKTITSIRAQRTYYSATVDRKMVNIDYDIWMLSESEMKALSSKHIILLNFLNRPIMGENRANMSDNPPIQAQSKVKESKANKSTVNAVVVGSPSIEGVSAPNPATTTTTTATTDPAPDESAAISHYLNHIEPEASKMRADQIRGWFGTFPPEVVMRAIDEAVDSGRDKRNYKYIQGILRDWEKAGLFTLSLVEGHQKAWAEKKAKKNGRPSAPGRNSKFAAHNSREWDYEALERMANNEM